ncbi:ATP-dependent helicase [Amycolatopsis sp. A1MSW2902]|uniref:ATP-dependent helicase n=1 Tax=Amycolatopsis sp. A1MSW2902 TaxID=687413 RepID=UPI00307D087F
MTPDSAATGWQPVGINDLEPAAWDALSDAGSTAVAAGPGAGKTEFLAQRAAYLLQTGQCAPPHRILAISFKRDAATNLGRRVQERVPEHADRFVSRTFDSFTKGLLDRFKAALPTGWTLPGSYELAFPSTTEQRDFIDYLADTANGDQRAALYRLPRNTFLAEVVGAWSLPSEPPAGDPADAAALAAWRWWQERFERPERPWLDFVMINRLAELLARTRPQIRRALRATYPFVFVDEFQDTTIAQFSFLKTVFTDAVITAVGDRKQRIMGFAGALPDAFPRFIRTFSACEYALAWNFRCTDSLVALQHVIAAKLDPTAMRAESRVDDGPAIEPVRLWRFNGAVQEAAIIASWIADDIDQFDRTAADFALVARQKVDTLEPHLRTALARHGIRLRNDDALCGKMRLQDLLKNEVTRLILGALRLAVHPDGLSDVWLETSALLQQVRGTAGDDMAIRNVHDELAQLTGTIRSRLASTSVDSATVVNEVVRFLGPDELRGYVKSAQRGEELEVVLDSFRARLAVVSSQTADWSAAFDEFEAADAVSLMTVHKSKGLEYHTVFFLGLDDNQWWSHSRDREGSTSAFFVGLSRAARRLIFTTTSNNTQGIAEFYDMLRRAGVAEQSWLPDDAGPGRIPPTAEPIPAKLWSVGENRPLS